MIKIISNFYQEKTKDFNNIFLNNIPILKSDINPII
jgi:hypothetical protein